jgi:hypothetical protein
VSHVSATKIFARASEDGRQLLAYSMNVSVVEDVAMVLPLPVPEGSAEDAVRFVDLSGYPNFLKDVSKAFPRIVLSQAKGGLASRMASPPTLKVHKVGKFEASFVPTRGDFQRLDARFRLPDTAWAALGRYQDWGFCVFKLRPRKGLFARFRRLQTIHPMAFEFPRRDPEVLFFPTLHVHDGEVQSIAHFDHDLYCQLEPELARLARWERSEEPIDRHVDVARSRGLVEGGAHAYRSNLLGPMANIDHTVDARLLRAMTRFGPSSFLRVAPYAGEAKSAAVVAERDRLATLASGAIGRILDAEAATWGLVPWDDELPLRHSVAMQPIEIPGGYLVPSAAPPGPCRVSFYLGLDRPPEEVVTLEVTVGNCPPRDTFDAMSSRFTKALAEVLPPLQSLQRRAP